MDSADLPRVRLEKWIGRRKTVHLIEDHTGKILSVHNYADECFMALIDYEFQYFVICADEYAPEIIMKIERVDNR